MLRVFDFLDVPTTSNQIIFNFEFTRILKMVQGIPKSFLKQNRFCKYETIGNRKRWKRREPSNHEGI